MTEFPQWQNFRRNFEQDPPIKSGDDTLTRKAGIFIEIASVALLPRNDVGNSRIP